MRRAAVVAGVLVGLVVAYALGHLALIEVGREVVALRTRSAAGEWMETRLWVVDDGGFAWLHGAPGSGWMQRLEADPGVELERRGETRAYRAVPVPEARARILGLLRRKYGIADWWVRLISSGGSSVPVRLEPLEAELAVREAFITVQGERLFYRECGRGAPVVLLHAGVADGRMWQPQLAALCESFHVIAPDLRGFGRSPLP